MNTCIIIDDENKARLLLRNMLNDIAPEIVVLDECDDLPNGIKAIKRQKPDIVFLDIEMPGFSGLSILDFFEDDEITFDIVFTTGYSEYAMQAFKLSATDYLLKPINPEMLQNTLNLIQKKNDKEKVIKYKALQENLHNSDSSEKCIIVNLSGITKFVKVKDIVMLEAEGSYCKIFLKNNEKLTTSKNLKYFEEKLVDFSVFFRCHKSNIVNLKCVNAFNRSEGEVMLNNNLKALISSEKMDLFLTKMESMY